MRKLFILVFKETTLPAYVPENVQFLQLTDNWTIDFCRLMEGVNANPSFYAIKQEISNRGRRYDVALSIQTEDPRFMDLIHSVEYRFDYEFFMSALGYKKVVLKKNKKDNFKVSFWTDQSTVVFVVIYLMNTQQVNIVHPIPIGTMNL